MMNIIWKQLLRSQCSSLNRFSSMINRFRFFLFGLIALSLSARLYLLVDPLNHPLIDDAGIVLRYLDNFRDGHFYTYNVSDGPVFGISGFVHGILTGALAYAQIQPEVALIASNFLGTFLTILFLLLLFNQTYRRPLIAILLTAVFLTSSFYVSSTFFIGLETPLHISLVVLAFYLLAARSRWIYPCCALLIISKLDSMGIVGVLISTHLFAELFPNFFQPSVADEILEEPTGQSIGHKSMYRYAQKILPKVIHELLLYFFLPLGIWVVFSTLVFGSPIPQSFISKNFYRAKANDGTAFPFFQPFLEPWRRTSTVLIGCSVLISFAATYVERKIRMSSVFFFAGLLTLIQYYYYNPGEKMTWYYTLPETLFLLGFLLTPACLFGHRWSRLAFVVLGSFLFSSIATVAYRGRHFERATIDDLHRWVDTVEQERIEVGRASRAFTPADGILMTGHGHMARESHRYILDYSGLNSKFATDHKNNFDELVEVGHPFSIAIHSLLSPEIQKQYQMCRVKSFYNVRLREAPAFNIFIKDTGRRCLTEYVKKSDITASRVDSLGTGSAKATGRLIRIHLSELNPAKLTFGVTQQELAQDVEIQVGSNKITKTVACHVPAAVKPVCIQACTSECSYEFSRADTGRLVVIKETRNAEVTLLDPTVDLRVENLK